jgi:hypothetical protein
VKLGTDIKAIWIASSPRCGSMWVFNVTREIARAAGLEVLPAAVPQTNEAMVAAATEGMRDTAPDRVRVVKVHSNVRPDIPNSRFILPRRDLRDAMVSFMRFMNRDFETGLEFVRNAMASERHYNGFPPERTLFVNYTDIVARPASVARTIAAFLEAPMAPDMANAIAGSLDKQSVARAIRRTEEDLVRRSRDGSAISADEVVVLGPQDVRAFDVATGFQSGHVSDYQEGDWKHLLTAQQRARLAALIAAADQSPAQCEVETV